MIPCHPLTFISGLTQQTTNWWYFSHFSQEAGFYISCKLSAMETICVKCQNLFPGKNKKKYFKMLSSEFFYPECLHCSFKRKVYNSWELLTFTRKIFQPKHAEFNLCRNIYLLWEGTELGHMRKNTTKTIVCLRAGLARSFALCKQNICILENGIP